MTRAARLARAAASGIRHTLFGTYPVEPDEAPASDGGPYPLDWTRHAPRLRTASDVPTTFGSRATTYHNPVAIALYALARHTEFQRASEEFAKDAFITQATFLRDRQDERGGWPYPVAVRRYGVGPGWYSAMAQGLALSVFVRASHLMGDESYLEAASAARDLMFRPTSDGGCAVVDDAERPFLEECPSDPPSFILNGAMFALIGAIEHDGPQRSVSSGAAVERLAELLPAFDNGHWSVYDLRFRVSASYAYHSLHVSQLAVLARMSGHPEFTTMAGVWRARMQDMRARVRAAVEKGAFALRWPR